MATIDLTMTDLDKTIENNDIVLIDFWAEWCGPCKMFGPIFDKAAKENPDLLFTKCDTENQPDLAAAFEVTSIPMLAVFREKILVYKQAGALPASGLNDIINQVKSLNMDDVRKQVAEGQTKV